MENILTVAQGPDTIFDKGSYNESREENWYLFAVDGTGQVWWLGPFSGLEEVVDYVAHDEDLGSVVFPESELYF